MKHPLERAVDIAGEMTETRLTGESSQSQSVTRREGHAVARRFAGELDETSDLARETGLASIREIIEKNENELADLEQEFGNIRGNPRYDNVLGPT